MADYYVSESGLSGNAGTLEAPWDIDSALASKYGTIGPGDNLWILAGTYVCADRSQNAYGYPIRMTGSAAAPIRIRPYQGGHVKIDGGITLHATAPPSYVWVEGLEIYVSEMLVSECAVHGSPRTTDTDTSSQYISLDDQNFPWGGMDWPGSSSSPAVGMKIIHCTIHGNGQGCGLWKYCYDAEFYGNLVYDNGWIGPDRWHGHCLYTQNEGVDAQWKIIENNMFFGGYGPSTIAAWSGSSTVFINYYDVRNNISWWGAYQASAEYFPLESEYRRNTRFGSTNPSGNRHLKYTSNFDYMVRIGFGYGGVGGDYWEITDNVCIWGDIVLNACPNLTYTGNFEWNANRVIWADTAPGWKADGYLLPNPEDGAPIPSTPLYKLNVSKYDPDRAHFAGAGFQGQTSVEVTVTGFLSIGDNYEIRDPDDFFGAAISSGTCNGSTITMPLTTPLPSWVTDENLTFGAFIVMKTASTPSVQRICHGTMVDDDGQLGQVIVNSVMFDLGPGITTLYAEVGDAQATCVDATIFNVPLVVRIVDGVCVSSPDEYQRIVSGVMIDGAEGDTPYPVILDTEAGDAWVEGITGLATGLRHRIFPGMLSGAHW